MIAVTIAAVMVAAVALAVATVVAARYVALLERRLDRHDESIAGLGTLLQEHLADHEPQPAATAWKDGSTPASYFHDRAHK